MILTGRYLPGYKDGGPLRTLVNMTEALGKEYEFYIICLDRDHGDEKAYSNISRDAWNQIGKAKVWYVSPGEWHFSFLKEMIQKVDLVYLTSFYDAYGYKTLFLNRMGLLGNRKVALASMGVFSEGALSQKSFKKKAFISLCKMLGLFKGITWSVTSELEKQDVERNIGKNFKYVIAEDLPRTSVPGKKKIEQDRIKKIIFLSRICPQKNLMFAIKTLQHIGTEVAFDIYGPTQDEVYWKQCLEELKKLPENIKWNYMGNVESEKVQDVFSGYDVFLFPTLGENYGHVIFEALSVGCIPVISDQTPWNAIEQKKAGYVLPLNHKQFEVALKNILQAPAEELRELSKNAVEIAKDKVEQSKRETGYRKIFDM